MSSDTYTVRAHAIDGPRINLHVLTGTAAGVLDYAYTRSFVLMALEEAISELDRHESPLKEALANTAFPGEAWFPENVGKFLESSRLVGRHNADSEDELEARWAEIQESARPMKERDALAWESCHWFEVEAVATDSKWLAHLRPGDTFGTTAYDAWYRDPASTR